jgi:signal peptidase
MGWVSDTVDSIKSIKVREALHQLIVLGMPFPFFFISLFLLFSYITNSSPIDQLINYLCVANLISGMIVTTALIIWKGLMCITGTESPVVVVLSGSMEPGFQRVTQI